MLQTRTIEPATLGLLKSLMNQPLLEPFYLVGGTALALQLGHRFSVDLDLWLLKTLKPD
jgi:Nucleotidyl transferase AbiEii toxin, Type IV TA system